MLTTTTINGIEVLMDYGCSCVKQPNNSGANAQEMLSLFKETFPYTILETIDGQCIQWDSIFIDKCLVAMSTGSLLDFSEVEKQVWFQFVEFQDALSHSATTATIGAIGCTVPNNNGESFVVTTNGITTTLCQNPQESVSKERQSKSLDSYFMALYNCDIPNDCGIIVGDVTDISPCPIL